MTNVTNPAAEQAAHRPPAIRAEGLEKRYPGGVQALRGVSFSVPAGTVFGLLGPNGAGKSTLVRILTTLSLPDRGSGVVAGLDLLREPAAVRRAIGVVAQRSGTDGNATGRENLLLHARLYGLRGAALTRRVEDLLQRFGLIAAGDRPARTYSGGMRRKLDVAMGLVHRPQVLFLDEPTTGLDPEARAEMWTELARLAGESSLTILLTTHYLEEADRLAQRLAIVDAGRVVAEGTPEELKRGEHGDTVSVELADPAAAAAAVAVLTRLPGIHQVAAEGRSLRARVSDGAGRVPAILASLSDAGIQAAAVTVARPTLDDVYLRYAGRSFAQAERTGAGADAPGAQGGPS